MDTNGTSVYLARMMIVRRNKTILYCLCDRCSKIGPVRYACCIEWAQEEEYEDATDGYCVGDGGYNHLYRYYIRLLLFYLYPVSDVYNRGRAAGEQHST